MHFAALVALAVAVSSVLGLAAPVAAPNSHLQVNPKRDPDLTIWTPSMYDRTPLVILPMNRIDSQTSPGEVVGSVITKGDDDSIPSKRSLGEAADSAITKRDDSIQNWRQPIVVLPVQQA